MNNPRVCCVFFALLLFLASADAQPIQVGFGYCAEAEPIGCGCNLPTRVPIADGENSWCIFWDRNGNGPDELDELLAEGVGYGQANYSCKPFNGVEYCGSEGSFFADQYLIIGIPPVPPDSSSYFIKVTGESCCWVSDTFVVEVGFQEIYLADDDWTCEDIACPFGEAPNPVQSISATMDAYCLQVDFTWEHDGQNVTGFNLYTRTDPGQPWLFLRPFSGTERSGGIPACVDGPIQIGLRAVNGAQMSDIVFTTGTTYLRHFPDQGAVQWVGGNDYRLNLVRPPAGGSCAAFLWFDFYSGGSFVERVLSVTNFEQVLEMTFDVTLPTPPNADCYIVMLDSFPDPLNPMYGCGLTDTAFFTVDANDAPSFVREFNLHQNYPNPFNPTTTIDFVIPSDGYAELAVFNLQGQRVATLLSGIATAGEHRVEWSASDIASGVYIYRLQTDTHLSTRKMVLMK